MTSTTISIFNTHDKGVSRRAILRDGAALAVAGSVLGASRTLSASAGRDARLLDLEGQWREANRALDAAYRDEDALRIERDPLAIEPATRKAVAERKRAERKCLRTLRAICETPAEGMDGLSVKLTVSLAHLEDWECVAGGLPQPETESARLVDVWPSNAVLKSAVADVQRIASRGN